MKYLPLPIKLPGMFRTEVSYRQIFQIAYPIILGSIAQNLINVTDTAFLGRVGEIALGAAAEFLVAGKTTLKEVVFCLFDEKTLAAYAAALGEITGLSQAR